MSLYESFLKPLLFRLPPETAHEFGMRCLRAGLGLDAVRKTVSRRMSSGAAGSVKRFGIDFPNPLGVAAGFDKNGKAVRQLAAIGFGFVEVGTVTLESQPGNPRPRLFRLPKDDALINRLGFNNDGARALAKRLGSIEPSCVLGVNIGKNKDVPNEKAVENYVSCFRLIHPVADYVAVNVSSPNTPGLRDLQDAKELDRLLSALQDCNDSFEAPRPLLLKIAPDLTDEGIAAAVETALRNRVDGIIATNTTVGREGLATPAAEIERIGPGGLSGRPVAARSCEVISRVREFSGGKMEIVGVGGIFSAEDAFDKIAAGASLLQAYTGFIYKGPGFAREMLEGLGRTLRERGYSSIDEAVGCGPDVREGAAAASPPVSRTAS